MGNQGNNWCFAMSTTFHVGLHLDIYELVWFILGIMIDATELYSLIPVEVILTFIQGHMDAKRQKLMQQLSNKVFYRFG